MPALSMSDGQVVTFTPGTGAEQITYAELRGLMFENAGIPTRLQALITKGPGNPPSWVEFDGRLAPSWGRAKIAVKQSTVGLVITDD